MPINVFCLVMHLTQLLWLPGMILYIVMWATNSSNQTVNQHGKIIVNWIITVLIFCLGMLMLIFIPFIGLINFILLPILMLCNLAFIIIGAASCEFIQTAFL